MKRCPQCRRDYYDETLLYCLDDGSALLEGPSSGNESATAILQHANLPGEAATKMLSDPAQTPSVGRGPAAKSYVKLFSATSIVVLLLVGGFSAYRYFSSTDAPPITSIAVVPFQNASTSPDTEYLSDGLAESLIYRLSQVPGLKVSPTSSVIRYKGKELDVAKVAAELGVQAVMTGRLAQIGNDLTISVELIDVRNNKLLWGERYDRKMADLLATQREMAASIAQKLQLKLSGEANQGLTKRYTESNEAYQSYLRGRFHASKRTKKDAETSSEYFHQAIASDPKFALAYAGLAEAYWFIFLYSYPQVDSVIPRSRELALKAIELDSTLAEPHSVLGVICNTYDRDFACMEREQRRAIELNPNFSEGHRRLGLVLEHLGRLDEARSSIERAVEIDPLSPITNYEVAHLLFFERKYEESEARGLKNLGLDPNFWYARLHLFYVYRMKRDHASAVEELARLQESRGEPDAAGFIRESFAAGDWQAFLRKITGERVRLKLYPYFVAGLFAELGEKDKAFAALIEALDTRDQHIAWMKMDPYMDPLRDDARFKEMLQRAGFKE